MNAPDIQPFLDHWDGKIEFDRSAPIETLNLPAVWDGTEWITKGMSADEWEFLGYYSWTALVNDLIPERVEDYQYTKAQGRNPMYYGPYRSFRHTLDLSPVPDPFTEGFTEEL